jgi:hypothetical protein
VCISKWNEWEHMHIYKFKYLWEIKLYWGSKIANKIR